MSGAKRARALEGLRSSPLAVAPKALSAGAPIPRPPREPFPLPYSRGALRPSSTYAPASRGLISPEPWQGWRGALRDATFQPSQGAPAPLVALNRAPKPAPSGRGLRPLLLRKYAPIVLFLRFFVRLLVELIIFASSAIFVGSNCLKNGALYFYYGAFDFTLSTY